MSILVFKGGTAIGPDRLIEDAVIVCRDGRIVSITQSGKHPPSAQIIDARGGYISPGFIDMHVHGGAGADFMDGTVEAVRRVCTAHARHGTTTIFPTTTTGSPAEIERMLAACRQAMDGGQPHHASSRRSGARVSDAATSGDNTSSAQTSGAQIAGVHLYGPYFAADKVGCHAQEGRRQPMPAEYKSYFDSGIIAIATCAAELPGADAFYRMAHRRGCLITCGHSNASWTEMQRAMDAGMRHVDHFWCAMSSVPSIRLRLGVPMQGSMNEFVLMHDEMSTEVIADGCHLAGELLEFAYCMKGAKRLCLVTDCNRALDMPPGEYRFGNRDDGTLFTSDGRVGWASSGSLASSVVGMDAMVRTMKKQTSASLPEVIRMASLTPAERTGIASRTGSLQRGKTADILVLSRRLEVKRVFIAGAECVIP